MRSTQVTLPNLDLEASWNTAQFTKANYAQAEQHFIQLLKVEDLDQNLDRCIERITAFEKVLNFAVSAAYQSTDGSNLARLFTQRILYRINRLKLFWYDDLQNYCNERSIYLQNIRNQIESSWQQWETLQLPLQVLQNLDVAQALTDRAAEDLEPELSANGKYFQEKMQEAGYRRLLAIASLDGLVEASQLSRTLGGVSNEVHSVLTRLLVEEYGAGRLSRKHSSYFTLMLEELNLETEPEAYLDLVPWEVLATINHSFLLSERKRYFLRYVGGLLYTEISVPAAFSVYSNAAQRLGLSKNATGYWDLHIKVDKLHGRWMLDEVALPLIDQYPNNAWELVFGYDQQKLMGDRAGAAVAALCREADTAHSDAPSRQGVA
ncbi:MAG: iron-containing redox enzyme family protein [Leptolyngbyaceae cyanobacterium RM2_2_4]|nr:iron-containing redox enzyme family protein [Leptolyngbyaceae cyanobacterium RM2_2_4]NJO67151.1 iron-containing redox enzyme family protein [Leptolyngbyaceae cyanobacterium RM1_405_57]